jgi:hypothetical protein
MKIYTELFANNLVPSTHSTPSHSGPPTATISDKEMSKKYAIGEKLTRYMERKWKAANVHAHAASLPTDIAKHLKLLSPIIELMEDHDISYINDADLKQMLEQVKANPSMYSYTVRDFLQSNPPEVPLGFSIPDTIDSYYYAVGYKDGVYTIAINRVLPTSKNYRKDVERGVFAVIDTLVEKFDAAIDNLKNSELHHRISTGSSNCFLTMRATMKSLDNYEVISLGITDARATKEQAKQSIDYLGGYYYFDKYFMPYFDPLVKSYIGDVWGEDPADYDKDGCLAFSIDNEGFQEASTGHLTKLLLQLVRKVSDYYMDIVPDQQSLLTLTKKDRDTFRQKVNTNPNLLRQLTTFYNEVSVAYADCRTILNTHIDALEKAMALFNSKAGPRYSLALSGESGDFKQDIRKHRIQQDNYLLGLEGFLATNKAYSLDPGGFLFDYLTINRISTKYIMTGQKIAYGDPFVEGLTSYPLVPGLKKASGQALTKSDLSYVLRRAGDLDLIPMIKSEPVTMCNSFGLTLKMHLS